MQIIRKAGCYQNLGDKNYFIPYPLPPRDPDFQFSEEIIKLYGEASFALGRLNEMGKRLPDPKRFIKAYVIKEALLSSAIEGIHTTIMDIFAEDTQEKKANKETQLVVNSTKALDEALRMIKQESLPISTRIILKTHEILLSSGEGDRSSPGYYRKQSVSVGNLVPAPATEVEKLMSDLEKYINNSKDLPGLIKTGLVHVIFETIHPFLDGNGRIGRLLIILMLINEGLIELPILYPSYYFKKYRLEYYTKLDRVRTHGDFEGWIIFFLEAIKASCDDAHKRGIEIEALEQNLSHMIEADEHFTKMRETAKSAIKYLFAKPVTTINEMALELNKAYNTVQKILDIFVSLNIVSSTIINKRNKIYKFQMYLSILEKD